jgi:hypothetical protein
MVIPFGAPEVAHFVHQGLEPVVHYLWLLPLMKHEATELPLDRFSFGDLGHLTELPLDRFSFGDLGHLVSFVHGF